LDDYWASWPDYYGGTDLISATFNVAGGSISSVSFTLQPQGGPTYLGYQAPISNQTGVEVVGQNLVLPDEAILVFGSYLTSTTITLPWYASGQLNWDRGAGGGPTWYYAQTGNTGDEVYFASLPSNPPLDEQGNWIIATQASPLPSDVPEPSTIIIWSLLGTVAVTVGWWRRRKAL
jgi:hypothetical protein